ncbi:MAG: triose-phosphate isomerase [Malacoplasma sp.]
MKKIVIGNWKMFKTKSDILSFKTSFYELMKEQHFNVTYGLAIPSIYLSYAKELFSNDKNMIILAQDCHYEFEGAYTGNVSWHQLKDIDIIGSLVGHSERREMFGDSDLTVNKKNNALLNNNMLSVVCVGETLEDYENNNSIEVVLNQVKLALSNTKESELKNLLIAYEPIWAIGTGKVPLSNDVDILMKQIRDLVASLYSTDISSSLKILYGGSVKPDNIFDFVSKENIDGVLVGSSSLKASDFFALLKESDSVNGK